MGLYWALYGALYRALFWAIFLVWVMLGSFKLFTWRSRDPAVGPRTLTGSQVVGLIKRLNAATETEALEQTRIFGRLIP